MRADQADRLMELLVQMGYEPAVAFDRGSEDITVFLPPRDVVMLTYHLSVAQRACRLRILKPQHRFVASLGTLVVRLDARLRCRSRIVCALAELAYGTPLRQLRADRRHRKDRGGEVAPQHSAG